MKNKIELAKPTNLAIFELEEQQRKFTFHTNDSNENFKPLPQFIGKKGNLNSKLGGLSLKLEPLLP